MNKILAGQISEEANDSLEKEKQRREWLQENAEFCEKYDGDKMEYIDCIHTIIKKFLYNN